MKRRGSASATQSLRLGLRRSSAALNEYGKYPRTWNFEQGFEVSHELMQGVSIAGSYWHGDFHNLTTTVNQSWSLADYSPYTWYNPQTGAPFTVYARTQAATSRATRNLDTYDPERKDVYESYAFEGKWRIPGGGQNGVFEAAEIGVEMRLGDAGRASDVGDPNLEQRPLGQKP